GLEPPRYCYRQPLKLVDLRCGSGLTRILRTDGRQERAAAHVRDDSIRTDSHTVLPLMSTHPWIVAAGAVGRHGATRLRLSRPCSTTSADRLPRDTMLNMNRIPIRASRNPRFFG